jgi:hypothetical protein
MTRLLKHFDELPLKVITVAKSDDEEVSSQFPALSPQTKPLAATTPLEQLMEPRHDPLAETHGWRHGGIND